MRSSDRGYGHVMTPPAHEDQSPFGTPPSQLRGGASSPQPERPSAPAGRPRQTDSREGGPDLFAVLLGVALVVGVVALLVVGAVLTGAFTR